MGADNLKNEASLDADCCLVTRFSCSESMEDFRRSKDSMLTGVAPPVSVEAFSHVEVAFRDCKILYCNS